MSTIRTVEWAACFCGIGGALLVAMNIGMATVGYSFFLAGALGYMIVGFCIRNSPLFFLNLVFAITNVIGLARH
jgi:hypothetical protein